MFFICWFKGHQWRRFVTPIDAKLRDDYVECKRCWSRRRR